MMIDEEEYFEISPDNMESAERFLDFIGNSGKGRAKGCVVAIRGAKSLISCLRC